MTQASAFSPPSPRHAAERLADIVVHMVGIAGAAAGGCYLITATALAGDGLQVTGVSLYAVCLIAALVCSLLYNATHPSPRKDLLRRFDHAGIFLLIAGTYTPFMLGGLSDGAVAIALVCVWAAALAGVTLKLAAPLRFHGVSIALYLALGWSGAIVFEPMRSLLGLDVLLVIGAGGVLYSAGVVFHVWERLPYQRAVWHGFVVAAAATHFGAVTLATAGAS